MTLKMFGIVASVSAVALTLSAGDAFARGGRGGVAAAPNVRAAVPVNARPFAHHQLRRGFATGFWPGGGFYYGGGPYGEPLADAGLPPSNDVNYTYTYKQDVPWDWAHRYPPNVIPSDRQYVPACSNEPVTVPGRDGEHTVNVMRCY
ncbi:MAG: hypothetical protein ACRC1G_16980 [Bradyrhizobium sp.]|nr:hypothetical protein [Bradyrhizobium sp.]